MRLMLIGAACAILLVACQSEDEKISAFRNGALGGCATAARREVNAAGVDIDRLCSCAIDRWMRGKSSSDLASASGDDPALEQVTRQCAMAQMQGHSNSGNSAGADSAKPATAPEPDSNAVAPGNDAAADNASAAKE